MARGTKTAPKKKRSVPTKYNREAMLLEYCMQEKDMTVKEFLLVNYNLKRASNGAVTKRTVGRGAKRLEYQKKLTEKHQKEYEKTAQREFMIKEKDLRASKKNAASASMLISSKYAGCLMKIAVGESLTEAEEDFLKTVKKYSMVKGLDDIMKQAMLLLGEPTSIAHTTGSMSLGGTDAEQAKKLLDDLQELHANEG